MGGDGLITDAQIYGNIIYENGNSGGSGINCDGVAESVIYNNLLYNNHSSGISLYKIDASAGSYNNKIFNNSIINADDGRWCLNINSGSSGVTVHNNILINLHSWRGSISIDDSSIEDFVSDYNILVDRLSNDWGNTNMPFSEWQALGYDANSILAESMDNIFINSDNGDYHLSEGSQAIDIGTDAVSVIVQYDIEGISRPQGDEFDIGAYEYEQETGINENNIYFPANPYKVFREGNFITFDNLNSGDDIKIYDIVGRLVNNSDNIMTVYRWDISNVPSGIYFYMVSSEGKEMGKGKVALIK